MKDTQSIPKLANRLGFSTAAVYVQLYDLYRKQRKKQRHFHAGRYWVRMPYEDLPRMFPHLSLNTVYDALKTLEDEGLLMMIHSSQFSWYAMDRVSRRVV